MTDYYGLKLLIIYLIFPYRSSDAYFKSIVVEFSTFDTKIVFAYPSVLFINFDALKEDNLIPTGLYLLLLKIFFLFFKVYSFYFSINSFANSFYFFSFKILFLNSVILYLWWVGSRLSLILGKIYCLFLEFLEFWVREYDLFWGN
jgi:hypothetical protein